MPPAFHTTFMQEPLISIIIPVYNVAQFLPRCLDSVLAQTYSNWECLLVDDGSKDTSGAICDEYARKDGRFKVYHKQNGGVSSARNFALDRAQGDYVTFVDSDDWIKEDCLKDSISEMQKNELDLLQFGYERRDGNGNISYQRHYGTAVLNHTQYLEEGKLNVCVWGSVYRRSIIEENHLRFLDGLKLAEDQLFLCSFIVKSRRLKSLSDSYYMYFVNQGSATKHQQTKDMLWSMEELERFASEYPETEKTLQKSNQQFLVDILINHDLTRVEYNQLFLRYSGPGIGRKINHIYLRLMGLSPYIAYDVFGKVYSLIKK